MLKFDEAERPSFVELAKLVLTSTDNTLESPNGTKMVNGKRVVESGNKVLAGNISQGKSIEISKKESKSYSMKNFKENEDTPVMTEKGHVGRKLVESSASDIVSA